MNITEHFKPENFNHSFINWFVLEAMDTKSGMRISETQILDKSKKQYDLKMQLNGVELDPVKSLNLLEKQFEEMVASKAVELIEQKYSPLFEKIDKIKNSLHDSLADIKSELGINEEY